MPCNQSNQSVGNSNVHSVGEELTALHRPNVLYMVSMSPAAGGDIGSTSTSYTQCRPAGGTGAKVGVGCAAGSHHQYRPNIIQIVPSVVGSGASSNDLFDCKCGPLVLNGCTRRRHFRTAFALLSFQLSPLRNYAHALFFFRFLHAFSCIFISILFFLCPLFPLFPPTPIYLCLILPPTVS